MAENSKYWYIKLNVNFFEDDRIDWLCEQQNGYAYVVLYIKLCLKTANNNGILTRQIGDIIIPYDVDKIAEVAKMDIDTVRVALELYKKIGLIYEVNEDFSFLQLKEVPKMVGCTTQYAIDKQKYREKKKRLQLQSSQDNQPDNVQDEVTQELRVKSKELRDKNNSKDINTSYCHYTSYNSNTQSTACAGVGKKRTPRKSYSERFEKFWSAYPKKKAKGDAEKAFTKLKPDDELLETILKALEWQRTSKDWTKDNGQYIPNPATYLNGRRWEDEQGAEVTSPEVYSKDKYDVEGGDFFW